MQANHCECGCEFKNVHKLQCGPEVTSRLHSWWRHQMGTFSALLAFCAGNSAVTSELPAQGQVTRSFDAFFDLRPNQRLSKQWWGWWFETPSCSLWRHCNVNQKSRFSSQTLRGCEWSTRRNVDLVRQEPRVVIGDVTQKSAMLKSYCSVEGY